MIYLILSIVTSTLIFVVFKLMARNNISVLPAIVVNYTVCVVEGIIAEGGLPSFGDLVTRPWFTNTLIMGGLFISVFYAMAKTVNYSGLAVASIANKLSLIIPVVAAYFLYDETFSAIKIIGIVVAMIAVILASYKSDRVGHAHNFNYYFFPLLVLIGSGIIDTFTKWNQYTYLSEEEFNLFLIFVFGTAAAIGWLILFTRFIYLKEQVSMKGVGYGILLGVPNYGTMYFLIAALNQPGWSSSTVFPINNIAIVALSCIVAMALFKEKMSRVNLAGILLSIIAIVLIMNS
jgi:drug/metabolite transporter (DMT)-like permease